MVFHNVEEEVIENRCQPMLIFRRAGYTFIFLERIPPIRFRQRDLVGFMPWMMNYDFRQGVDSAKFCLTRNELFNFIVLTYDYSQIFSLKILSVYLCKVWTALHQIYKRFLNNYQLALFNRFLVRLIPKRWFEPLAFITDRNFNNDEPYV